LRELNDYVLPRRYSWQVSLKPKFRNLKAKGKLGVLKLKKKKKKEENRALGVERRQ